MKRRKYTITLLGMIAVLLFSNKAYAQPRDHVIENTVELCVWDVANEFNISPYLLSSLVYQESRFIVMDNLTQITNKSWFKEGLEYCGSDDITNPYVNIRCCGYYLHKWAEEFPGEPALWLMCWNCGYDTAVEIYNPNRPSVYAKEILNRADEWSALNDGYGVFTE